MKLNKETHILQCKSLDDLFQSHDCKDVKRQIENLTNEYRLKHGCGLDLLISYTCENNLVIMTISQKERAREDKQVRFTDNACKGSLKGDR